MGIEILCSVLTTVFIGLPFQRMLRRMMGKCGGGPGKSAK